MRFFYVAVVVTLTCFATTTRATAQCNDYENLINYSKVYIRDSDRDRFGNLYVIGYFNSDDFQIGPTKITREGDFSFFLLKFDKDFNLLWAKSTGDYAFGRFVEVDHDDNVVVSGQFYGSMTF